jgi:RNA polymerase sigma-70 factor, ECF subfamily
VKTLRGAHGTHDKNSQEVTELLSKGWTTTKAARDVVGRTSSSIGGRQSRPRVFNFPARSRRFLPLISSESNLDGTRRALAKASRETADMATTVRSITDATEATCFLHQNIIQQFTAVIGRSLPLLHRIALNRLGNEADAEDAVQDAFLSAYTHLHQFKGQSKMSTWLTSIVINSTRMKIRRRPRQLHISLDENDCTQDSRPYSELLSDRRATPEEIYQVGEVEERLAKLVTRLSPPLRIAFQMRQVHGLTTRETAKALGVPAGTVKAQLARARMQLKKLLHKKSCRRRNSTCGNRSLSH